MSACVLRNLPVRSILALLILFVSFGCSSSDSAEGEAPTPVAQESAGDPGNDTSVATEDSDGSGAASQPDAGEVTIDDEDLAAFVELDAGEQVQDGVGNLIVVYEITVWPAGFEALSSDARAAFGFVDAIDRAVVVDHELYAVDVGLCAAGLDAGAGGTVDFYVHLEGDEPLAATDSVNRAAFGTEPVALPGFTFPAAAQCARGWLPVYWDRAEPPGIVRYVLSARNEAGEVEESVYQWDVATSAVAPATGEGERFAVGQTVTFNSGALQGSTVVVDGWAELVGTSSAIEGTRMVGLSLTVCPGGPEWPIFVLALDGWNLAVPVDLDDRLGAEAATTVAGECFEGWLEFAVPFGTTPTGFTASDGVDFVNGFAEWSLDGAALATPR